MKRNSPNDFQDLDDVSCLDVLVHDKRRDKRTLAKRDRRDRHYRRQFLKWAERLVDDGDIDDSSSFPHA